MCHGLRFWRACERVLLRKWQSLYNGNDNNLINTNMDNVCNKALYCYCCMVWFNVNCWCHHDIAHSYQTQNKYNFRLSHYISAPTNIAHGAYRSKAWWAIILAYQLIILIFFEIEWISRAQFSYNLCNWSRPKWLQRCIAQFNSRKVPKNWKFWHSLRNSNTVVAEHEIWNHGSSTHWPIKRHRWEWY